MEFTESINIANLILIFHMSAFDLASSDPGRLDIITFAIRHMLFGKAIKRQGLCDINSKKMASLPYRSGPNRRTCHGCWTKVGIWEAVIQVLSRSANRCFIGLPLYRNQ
ncbi:uncharacterized protein DFL_007646 [Arthrobotrys flagrans]|uniref:Uncharacterized protein n=1 Tax=Arthrobotrys flagrans TaxID=97331 RepID=A0A436ZW86_ARTFL|nr:hypothetical protein DFL_007646 [Arthrobotrys flagrans]